MLTKSKTSGTDARSSVFCIRGLPLNNLLTAATAIDTCHNLISLMDRRQRIAASTYLPILKPVWSSASVNMFKFTKTIKIGNANPV